ncbi:MAG: glycoside hydrolase family 43 protein [Bacteroidales bacterium]|nr:glycoside hydrolase family 43 protein [Bacteroidales bacterium]
MKKLALIVMILSAVQLMAQNSSNILIGMNNGNPFAASPDPDDRVSYHNPVIPGFYSDPSVCRVGEDYYLITSTFEYFPGVPVFHSRDLVNWEQIGHCLTREEQIPLGINIFAATLRYNEGTFYMITTNITGGGNFYVTATDPAGPWSDPTWIKVGGIDPDLFFDEDGRAYVISSTFVLNEIDIQTGQILTEGRKVWNGTGGRYAEGPHIYKKDGFYYLMAAEGGTEEAHSETIARSQSIWGPYTENRSNPILAHANAAGQGNPIQGVGHADMIQAHDGSWWMVFHGYRNLGGSGIHHTLGRETCLAPVTWPKNGWPVVNGNGTAKVTMTCPTLPLHPFEKKPSRIGFDSGRPGLEWNYFRFPVYGNYSVTERPGYLRLKGSAVKIGDNDTPTFVGRRLQDMFFSAVTSLDFNPDNENEAAGMILLNNGSHFDIMVGRSGGKRILSVTLQFGSLTHESKKVEIGPGPVSLKIKGGKTIFTFSYSQGDGEFIDLQSVDAKFLSSETVGGFTGVYVGLYTTGNGSACKASADYDWFEYVKEPETEQPFALPY